jgi:plastocyanin
VKRTASTLVALAAAGAALATQALGAPDGAAAGTVKVTVREYAIVMSPASIAAGSVTFTVHNAGRTAHVIAVSGGGLAAVRTPLIPAGATRTLRVKLGGGTVRLWCPVGGHAALGMKATLRVRGAVAPTPTRPTPTPPPTTTDPGYGGDGY